MLTACHNVVDGHHALPRRTATIRRPGSPSCAAARIDINGHINQSPNFACKPSPSQSRLDCSLGRCDSVALQLHRQNRCIPPGEAVAITILLPDAQCGPSHRRPPPSRWFRCTLGARPFVHPPRRANLFRFPVTRVSEREVPCVGDGARLRNHQSVGMSHRSARLPAHALRANIASGTCAAPPDAARPP
jgi:hypothetical protein